MHSGPNDIFGDVSEGVPNPLIPHVHPYPTRYHGPIWNQPMFTKPFVQTQYASAPYAGLGAISGTNASLLISVQLLSAAASGYHGYKRHGNSPTWGLLWAALGLAFPIVVPAVAVGQGYGKPEKKG